MCEIIMHEISDSVTLPKFALTLILGCFIHLTPVLAETYFITETADDTCPNENMTCSTLTEFAQQPQWLASSNITLIFTPGIYHLSSDFEIQNVKSLILKAVSPSLIYLYAAVVICNTTGFIFEDILEVSISGIEFRECIGNIVRSVDVFRVEGSRFFTRKVNSIESNLESITNATILKSSFVSSAGWGDSLSFFDRFGKIKAGAAIRANNSSVLIHDCWFDSNIGEVGGAIYSENSKVSLLNTEFRSNVCRLGLILYIQRTVGGCGGAIYGINSDIDIYLSKFVNNHDISASLYGGYAIYIQDSNINIHESQIISNRGRGCAIYIDAKHEKTTVTRVSRTNFVNNSDVAICLISDFKNHFVIVHCEFIRNGGGAILIVRTSNVTIYGNTFTKNSAHLGGAINTHLVSNMTIESCKFINNQASDNGGAIHTESSMNVVIKNSSFVNNSALKKGGAICTQSTTLTTNGLYIANSSALAGVIFAQDSSVIFSGYTIIVKNNGSLYAFSSNFEFVNYTRIDNNFIKSATNKLNEGGAITSFQGNITLTGTVFIAHNKVYNGYGGAVISIESKIFIYGDTIIEHNIAESGGGIYAHQSELNFMGKAKIRYNAVSNNGGGIYAVGTATKLYARSQLQLFNNTADKGGGIHLELNAKIYSIKSEAEIVSTETANSNDCCYTHYSNCITECLSLLFTGNSAAYGGALFISDEVNSGSCATDTQATSSECFFQQLALHSEEESYFLSSKIHIQNTKFEGNSASVKGATIFGGLLDRCTVSPYSEIFNKYHDLSVPSVNAVTWLTNFTNLHRDEIQCEISSKPVRVCFCNKKQQNCTLPPPSYQTKKGQPFKISLVTVDQVNNSILSNVSAFLSSHNGGLGEDQAIQKTRLNCTELTYTIVSPHESEQLILYADGPCKDTGISRSIISVKFRPCTCPIGFVKRATQSNCTCDCDPQIYPEYVTSCSYTNESIMRKSNTWISYITTTNESSRVYIKHSHCPFGYCHPSTKQVWINLNVPNGADAQCAFNRSGKLCGSCEEGLSLSFGSSKCMSCFNNHIALLIVFITAGIALVTFVLVCNMTVAVGTINGLIFYANIIAANRSIFIPSEKLKFKFLTIFISWINLDFGFEICFFDGMESYTKTWLQLVFPLYVITLVAAIIIISDYSFKFAALFRRKDPIATLATLILLSYTKLLRTIIAALSFTRLDYSDGSHELVWLTDANVPYLKGKHIPLFIAALLIVIVGMIYTLLIFGWQWINMLCPKVWITTNTKLNSFMDSYHNPYNKNHRYWIGLLLLVRVILYVISAVNVLGDPRINLLSINSVVVILYSFQTVMLQKHKIHKRFLTHTLEHIFLFNVIALTSVTFYITEDKESQAVVAYFSLSITLATFLFIQMYHTYLFILKKRLQNLRSFIKNSSYPNWDHMASITPETSTNNENEVSVTEINGLPEIINTDDESQNSQLSSTASDSEEEPETERNPLSVPEIEMVDVTEFDAILKAINNTIKFHENQKQVSLQSDSELEQCKLSTQVNSPSTSFYTANTSSGGSKSTKLTNAEHFTKAALITISGDNDDDGADLFEDDETTPLLLHHNNY